MAPDHTLNLLGRGVDISIVSDYRLVNERIGVIALGLEAALISHRVKTHLLGYLLEIVSGIAVVVLQRIAIIWVHINLDKEVLIDLFIFIALQRNQAIVDAHQV